LALKKGKPGEVYNISSGKSHAIFDILQTLLGYSTKRISIQKDPARTRPTDARKVAGDSRKLKKITGWKTQIPLATTLLDTLNYWREKVF
jgi:GDP-4-dehydro-6-deoxy-D-mannose reductase